MVRFSPSSEFFVFGILFIHSFVSVFFFFFFFVEQQSFLFLFSSLFLLLGSLLLGTCRIWVLDQGMEGSPLETIRLNSAGHSVRWHADHPQVLMLGQEEGPPRLYDLREGSVVVNFDSSLSGDVSYDADWSAADGNRIGCVFPEKWLMWDKRAPSQPLEGWEGTYPSSVSGNLQPARRFRFSPKSPDTFAISTSTAVYKFDLPLNRTAEAVPVASNTVGDITWMGSWLVSGNVQQYAMCLAGIRST